jgi:hypothetical protein
MNLLDPKLHQKLGELENLDQIEARLACQERNTHMALIAMIILAAPAFAVLLSHILAPSRMPLGH